MRGKGSRKLCAGLALSLLLAGCGSGKETDLAAEEQDMQIEGEGQESGGAELTKEAADGTEVDGTDRAGETESGTQTELTELQEGERSEAMTTAPIVFMLPTEAEEAEIHVEPIENLSEDFIRGVDISSVLAQERSGVVYYNEDGAEQDIFRTLAENGVNYIRVRLRSDPYDAADSGYSGVGCDTAAAAEIGRRAARYGMRLCVDFHYADFWADPSEQTRSKAWEDYGIDEKADAFYNFTADSLNNIMAAGADVGMVQIGTEINDGLAGETGWDERAQLLAAGSRAVRDMSKEWEQDIRVAVHFTDVSDKSGTLGIAETLRNKEIDYDVFAVSYYPFRDGTRENLTDVLNAIVSAYGKEVMVTENSYPYTGQDGDDTANSVSGEGAGYEYEVSVQGQASEIRDVCAAVASVGDKGIGYFYREPAWIPVYDADAGKYYGGSSWDNQALFDFSGRPLESLKTFKYLYYGCTPSR